MTTTHNYHNNISLSTIPTTTKLEFAKQEAVSHSKTTLLEKDLTIDDATTFSELSLDHTNSKDHNQSLLDNELHEVSLLKDCLSESPTQVKIAEGLGGYIRDLIGQLEGYYTMAQQMQEKTEQPKEIITGLDKQINALGDWLKGQQVKTTSITPAPIVANKHVNAVALDFCLNDDFDLDNSHEEREQSKIQGQVLPNLNESSQDDFLSHQYRNATKYAIEGFRQGLESSQRAEKTYCPENETLQQTVHHVTEIQEIQEAVSVRKTSESATYKGTCLKKHDSKGKEGDAKKTVSFTETPPRTKDMDVRRYLLEQYRKDKKKVAKIHYGAGWD